MTGAGMPVPLGGGFADGDVFGDALGLDDEGDVALGDACAVGVGEPLHPMSTKSAAARAIGLM